MSEKKPAYLKVLARTLRSYAGSACLSLDLSHALDEAAEELDRRAEPATHTGDLADALELLAMIGCCGKPNGPKCKLEECPVAALAARKGGGE